MHVAKVWITVRDLLTCGGQPESHQSRLRGGSVHCGLQRLREAEEEGPRLNGRPAEEWVGTSHSPARGGERMRNQHRVSECSSPNLFTPLMFHGSQFTALSLFIHTRNSNDTAHRENLSTAKLPARLSWALLQIVICLCLFIFGRDERRRGICITNKSLYPLPAVDALFEFVIITLQKSRAWK